MKNNNKKAFTLAEALITMTVLGIIGMLSIPALKMNSGEKQYIGSVSKAYNVLYTATSVIEIDHGPSSTWAWADAINWYKDTMNGIDATGTYTVKKLDGTSTAFTFGSDVFFSTPDGMLWTQTAERTFAVDINGKSGPNIEGVDVHVFNITNNGEVTPANNCTNYAIFGSRGMYWIEDDSTTDCNQVG